MLILYLNFLNLITQFDFENIKHLFKYRKQCECYLRFWFSLTNSLIIRFNWCWWAVKALNKARLEASVRVQGVNSAKKKGPSPYAIASGVLLLLSFLKYFYYPFHWLALGSVAFGIIPIIFRALSALRNLTLGDINILLVITGTSYLLISTQKIVIILFHA